MNQIKALFVDINGVLFEQEERFSVRYSREFGIPIEKLNAFLDFDMDLCLTGKADLKIRLAELLDDWKWNGTVDELLDYWFETGVPVYTKLTQFLNSLTKDHIQILLATQNEKYKTERFLKKLGSSLKYDNVISTYQIGHKKSDPRYFVISLAKFKLKPEEVVLIDNNEKAVKAAETVGLNTIFFENEEQVIADLKNLLKNQ